MKTKSLSFPSASLIRKLHNFTAKAVPICVKCTDISFLKYTDRVKAPTLLTILKMLNNSDVFWNHVWQSAQWRALCTKISEVNESAFFYAGKLTPKILKCLRIL